MSNENQLYYNKNLVGKKVEVLFEDKEIQDGVTYYKGHTQNYILVKYKTDKELENNLEVVEIVEAEGEYVKS